MIRPTVYLVPGLALVSVAADVPALVSMGIDFQLGHFAVDADASLVAEREARIDVAPYARFAGEPGSVCFHGQLAERGSLLNAPSARHAVRRTAQGFEVFTDSPEVLVVLLLQTLALARGRTFLHAAGWCDVDGAATLLPGPGGVGKTALLAAAVQRHGVRLLGDDLVLVGASGAEAFPRAFVLKEYHRDLFPAAFADVMVRDRPCARWRPLVKFLRENAPCHGMLKSVFRRAGRLESTSSWLQMHAMPPEFHTVPVARLFGADSVAASGLVRRVIWLERHTGADFHSSTLAVDEVVRRSLAVLHHEWADWLRWFSALGAVGLVDLGAHFRATEEAMHAAFAKAEVSLLQVPERASPAELECAFAERLGFSAGLT